MSSFNAPQVTTPHRDEAMGDLGGMEELKVLGWGSLMGYRGGSSEYKGGPVAAGGQTISGGPGNCVMPVMVGEVGSQGGLGYSTGGCYDRSNMGCNHTAIIFRHRGTCAEAHPKTVKFGGTFSFYDL